MAKYLCGLSLRDHEVTLWETPLGSPPPEPLSILTPFFSAEEIGECCPAAQKCWAGTYVEYLDVKISMRSASICETCVSWVLDLRFHFGVGAFDAHCAVVFSPFNLYAVLDVDFLEQSRDCLTVVHLSVSWPSLLLLGTHPQCIDHALEWWSCPALSALWVVESCSLLCHVWQPRHSQPQCL